MDQLLHNKYLTEVSVLGGFFVMLGFGGVLGEFFLLVFFFFFLKKKKARLKTGMLVIN